jgi:hypothetical protein
MSDTEKSCKVASDGKARRLDEAAEQLVMAAFEGAKDRTIANLRSELHTVKEELKNVTAKLDALTLSEEDVKRRRIIDAIEIAKHMTPFGFEGGLFFRKDSTFLIPRILGDFAVNNGFNIDSFYITKPFDGDGSFRRSEPSDESKKRFRDKLVDVIHALLGVRPVVEKDVNEEWYIWYS